MCVPTLGSTFDLQIKHNTWLERDFDPITKAKAAGGYHLLILNGHNLHTTY